MAFYWTVEGGKESSIGSGIVKLIKIEDGVAELRCDMRIGSIPSDEELSHETQRLRRLRLEGGRCARRDYGRKEVTGLRRCVA